MLKQGTCGSVPQIELDEDLDKLVSYHMTRFAQPFKRFRSLKRHVDNLQLLSDAARDITPDEGYRYDIVRNGADVLIKLLEDPDFTFEIFDPVVHDILRIMHFQVDGTSNRYTRKQKLAVVLALARADHRYEKQLTKLLDAQLKKEEALETMMDDDQANVEGLQEGITKGTREIGQAVDELLQTPFAPVGPALQFNDNERIALRNLREALLVEISDQSEESYIKLSKAKKSLVKSFGTKADKFAVKEEWQPRRFKVLDPDDPGILYFWSPFHRCADPGRF
jgi:hypothetical protein